MPIKLIGILMLVVLVAVLTGFNLSNRCTIWFFHNFENIPVFAAILGSFLVGVAITLPFTFKKSAKGESAEKTKKFKKEKKSKIPFTPEQTEPENVQ
jgi:uncharacterized integral membrane protein